MVSMPRLIAGIVAFVAYLIGIAFLVGENQNIVLYLALLAAGTGLFFLGMYTGVLTTPGNVRRIRAYGREANARVLEIADTGVTINKSPYVRMRLRVEPGDRAPYETTLKVLVSRVAIPRVGDVIGVKYDPDKPEDVIPA